MRRNLIVCIDCGDTIVDESTQVFDPDGTVRSAEAIPGAPEAILELQRRGYTLALVADGRTASFENILKRLKLWDVFDARAISEELGAEKPDAVMFQTALRSLGLSEADAPRAVMIGNNLKRDVLGANRMGMTSVLLSYSPRYCMIPETKEETPDYVAATPSEWPALIERIEQNRTNSSR